MSEFESIHSKAAVEGSFSSRWKEAIFAHALGLVHATSDNLDGELNRLLAAVGGLAGAHRSYYFKLDGERALMSNTHEWCAEGVSSEKDGLQGVPTSAFPWWMSKLEARELILIHSLAELPPEAAAEKDILEPQGICSLVVLPVEANGELIGFFGFDAVECHKEWGGYEVEVLKLVTSLLGVVLAKFDKLSYLEKSAQAKHDELLQTKEKFNAVFDRGENFMCLVDPQGFILDLNPKAREILDWPSVSPGTMLWSLGFFADDPSAFKILTRFFSAAGSMQADEFQVKVSRGRGQNIIRFIIMPLISLDRQLSGYLIEGRDVTALEMTREALAESEQRFKFALAGSELGVWDWSIESGSVYYSDQVIAMLGHKPGSFRPTLEEWSSRLHPEDKNRSFEVIDECLRGPDNSYQNEHRLLCKTGDYKWFVARGLVIKRSEDGRALRMVGTLADISEGKEAEQRMRIANETMARAALMKDEFLASMSHELRTPLTGILTLSEVLLDKTFGPLNDKQLEFVNRIEESGRHLLELINDILDISKIEAGQAFLDLTQCGVDEVCQAALRLVREMAAKKSQKLILTTSPEGMVMRADARRLKQILVNLLSNAVKFTGRDGEIRLEVIGDEVAGMISFKVCDSGIGISSEKLEQLFKPFIQLESKLSRNHKGTGLGLALVRQLAELHGGSVGVKSGEGVGSEFQVSLPWNTLQGEKVTESVGSTKTQGSNNAEGKELILLVDDNPVNVEAVKSFLENKGYRIEVAGCGESGVEKYSLLMPDLILMDIQMPGMDGLEATKMIREMEREKQSARTPIIALTALAMPGDRERCLSAGCDDYLSKPVGLKHLLATIEKLILLHQDES